MKWILILIFIFCTGVTIDWDATETYEVIVGSITYEYRPPTKIEVDIKEVNEKYALELKTKQEIGQEWYKKQGRNYSYSLSKQVIVDINKRMEEEIKEIE